MGMNGTAYGKQGFSTTGLCPETRPGVAPGAGVASIWEAEAGVPLTPYRQQDSPRERTAHLCVRRASGERSRLKGGPP